LKINVINRESIITILRANRPYLEKEFGVVDIALFGSYSKQTENAASDIDIYVELNEPTFKKYINLNIFLEKALSAKVHIVRRGPHLSQQFLQSIQKEIIHV